MTHSIHRDLVTARALIADPASWTQCAFARDRRGADVSPTSDDACRWDAVGALKRVAGKHADAAIEALSEAVYRTAVVFAPMGGLSIWNDQHSHSDILAAYDVAIDLASDIEREAA